MQIVGYVRTGREGGPALVLAAGGEPSVVPASEASGGSGDERSESPGAKRSSPDELSESDGVPASEANQGSSDERSESDGGELERVPLEPGAELAYTLGERHCAGRIADDAHESCAATAAPYCDRHADRWPCARCAGDCDKPLDSCDRPHAIYLAGFAPDVHKVGVTKAGRLDTRLREQGADRAAHLRTVEDGRIARAQEAALADRIPDRVRVPTKVAGLHREFDEAAWEALLAGFDPEERFAFDYGLDLATAPVPETTATGVVRGVTGRILVLEDAGTAYAVDLRDLLGYEVEAGASDRERQSSLGAFS